MAFTRLPGKANRGIVVLGLGFLLGLLLAFAITSLWPVSFASLDEARQRGILSPGVILNYPKYQDTLHYALWLSVPVAAAIAVWLCWALIASHRAEADEARPATPPAPGVRDAQTHPTTTTGLEAVFLGLGVLVLAYSPAAFFGSGLGWIFMQDQGVHLSAVTNILHGRVMYRDFHFLWDPLMVYPLVPFMLILGPSALTFRVYNFILQVAALLAIAFMLRRLLRHRLMAYGASLLFVAMYFPLFPATHAPLLRTTPAVGAVFMLWLALEKRSPRIACAAGVMGAFALFYSQEGGVAALLALIAMLATSTVKQWSFRRMSRHVVWCAGGLALVFVPVLAFLGAQGALGAYIGDKLSLASYRVTSYPGFPYPNLIDKLRESMAMVSTSLGAGVFPPRGFGFLAETFSYYLPVVLYMLVSLDLAARLLGQQFTNRDVLKTGLVVLGAALFPYALSLSALWAVVATLPPAIFLALLYTEDLSTRGSSKRATALRRLGITALVGGLFLFMVQSTASGPFVTHTILKLRTMAGAPVAPAEWYGEDTAPLTIPRAKGSWVTKDTRQEIEAVVPFVQERTSATERIFVFAMSPAYYFLTDRANSTRYDFFSMPNTREDRRRVVTDLEQDLTRLVILDRGGMWGIPQEVMEPEIAQYLDERYEEVFAAGTVRVLQRKGR